MRHHSFARYVWLLCLVLLVALAGCSSKAQRPAAPLAGVSVGIVGVVQPMGTTDLLAGYIPEARELASAQAMLDFDTDLLDKVRAQADSARTIVPLPGEKGVNPSSERVAGRNTALQHWVEVGRKAGVDLLIVPQILDWHEREGSSAGVISSAAVDVQFYLIDVEEGVLLNRSVFREKQQSLSSDLLHAGNFFKRGGKWITARQLSGEGMDKMITEFGL
ncbi:MAG TPA: nucleoid-structuring protein H-NS [Candidatus Avidesulfovibrio excrementigallinarum]|nr:nucleoid-structuring protein H-NS [Candidatus Avidesulfovibrio excrementigallinarum]